MIKWNLYFDKIYCVHFLPHKERLPLLLKELKRVGILDSGIFEWRYTIPDKYDDIIWPIASRNKWCSRKQYVNLALENHRILTEARLLELKRILIIEDDILFLTDISLIENILNNIPNQFGIVQFDKRANFTNGEQEIWLNLIRNKKINQSFVDSTYNFANATAMGYFYSGIDDAFNVLEKRLCTPDRIVKFICKHHAIAITSLAVQNLYDNAINLTFDKAEKIHYECYRQVGVDLSLYGESYGK